MCACLLSFIHMFAVNIDPFNKYIIRNFHPMTLNSFQFAFWILFNFIYCLRLIKTINEVEKNSKTNWKKIWRHWLTITYFVLIKRVYKVLSVRPRHYRSLISHKRTMYKARLHYIRSVHFVELHALADCPLIKRNK